MILDDRYEYTPSTDRLGKGGFGSVYKAYDLVEKRVVALKFVPQSKLPERYSLLEETERIRQLDHPNLVKYYDFFIKEYETVSGEIDEMQIGVMEYINGGDLGAFMKMEIAKSQARVYPILLGILRGLDYLHQCRIIHRDVKPQNILLQLQEGLINPKLADFGISKQMQGDLTSVSAPVGTYEYMSPEQLGRSDAKLGPSTDIWAFGVLAYQLFTGTLPFGSRRQGDTDGQIIANILDANYQIEIKDIPAPYDRIVEKCLQKAPDQRYERVSEIMDILANSTVAEQNISLSMTLPESDKLADTHIEFNTQTQLPNFQEQNEEAPFFEASSEEVSATKIHETSDSSTKTPPVPKRKTKSRAARKNSGNRANVLILFVLLISALGWGAYLILSESSVENTSREDLANAPLEDETSSEDSSQEVIGSSRVPIVSTAPTEQPEFNETPEPEEEQAEISTEVPEDIDIDIETPEEEPSKPKIPKIDRRKPQEEPRTRPTRIERKKLPFIKRLQKKYQRVEVSSAGFLVESYDGKWGFFGHDERLLIPPKYDDLSHPQEGLAAALSRGKWGYLTLKGKTAIPFKFDAPGNFFQGKAKVILRGRDIVINKKGKCIENCN